ncbi:hypothetical protein VNO77_01649 [Canavalia gladiata]|uniref:Uncharacterized protein n=1 Tax=Canavalia gladiata TaxID=3824 RepID=A0AAN9MS96_CANGL
MSEIPSLGFTSLASHMAFCKSTRCCGHFMANPQTYARKRCLLLIRQNQTEDLVGVTWFDSLVDATMNLDEAGLGSCDGQKTRLQPGLSHRLALATFVTIMSLMAAPAKTTLPCTGSPFLGDFLPTRPLGIDGPLMRSSRTINHHSNNRFHEQLAGGYRLNPALQARDCRIRVDRDASHQPESTYSPLVELVMNFGSSVVIYVGSSHQLVQVPPGRTLEQQIYVLDHYTSCL